MIDHRELEAITRLEATGRYKVLQRLELPTLAPFDMSTPIFRGAFVDGETTGLEIDSGAKIIEAAILPFQWAAFPTGAMFAQFEPPLRMLCDPGETIPPNMTAIHGLKDEDVAGKVWDREAIDAFFAAGVDMVVSHHAAFDRPFFETIDDRFKSTPWGCSAEQVPWSDHGFSGRKLEYILMQVRQFYDAHHAVDDCRAGVFALSIKVGQTTALQHVIDATKRRTWRLECRDPPGRKDLFHAKDAVKARGYRWSPEKRCWHKAIAWDDDQAEQEWLATNVYRSSPMPITWLEVTARDRFSSRG